VKREVVLIEIPTEYLMDDKEISIIKNAVVFFLNEDMNVVLDFSTTTIVFGEKLDSFILSILKITGKEGLLNRIKLKGLTKEIVEKIKFIIMEYNNREVETSDWNKVDRVFDIKTKQYK